MRPITLYTTTDIGKVRNTNEDSVASLLINNHSFNSDASFAILVVADGMGGHELGEVASDIASKKFIEVVTDSIFSSLKNRANVEIEEIIKKAVFLANKEVWDLSKKNSDSIGTTLVGAVLSNNNVFIANVGDSRAYLINPHKSLIQITKDHSVVQDMLDANIITKEHAKNHPRKNLLTRALGLSEDIQPDIFKKEIENEIILLCSDGLYGMLDDSEILNTFNGNVFKSATNLISTANNNGGIDNISVALACYDA